MQRVVAYRLVAFAILCGIFVSMKKTLVIDDDLLQRAKAACHATTDTETIRLGLEALVRHAAYQRLRALRGSEPKARDVKRRRTHAASGGKAA